MIRVTDLCVRAGDFALRNVSFDVPQGQYGVLMGQTGCGKTTLLETICGLKTVASGRIELAGRDVTLAKPAERDIGYVPQDGALFSTMTIRDHLGFGPRIRKWPRREIRQRTDQLAQLLGITHLLKRKPHGLSGGERQRVALGRALAYRPKVICLDEPLSALDDATRHQMYDVLKQAQQAEQVTALHVTHSLEEAGRLGDVLLRMEAGQVTQQQNADGQRATPTPEKS